MKRWIIACLLLFIGLWIGLKIQSDPGLIFIRYQQWTIQTTLWFGVCFLLVCWVILHILNIFFKSLIHIPKQIACFFVKRSKRLAEQNMLLGFSFLLKENFHPAEKHFAKAARQSQQYRFPCLNYLLAAYATHKLCNYKQVKIYLQKARNYAFLKQDAHLQETIDFFELRIAIEENNENLELFKIHELLEKKSNQPYLLKMLKNIYIKKEQWEYLLHLLPKLKKIFSFQDLFLLQCQIYEALIKQTVKNAQGAHQLMNTWKKIPQACRVNPNVLIAYIDGMKYYGMPDEAEKVLISTIKRTKEKKLIIYYFSFSRLKESQQIAAIEKMILSDYSNDPILLYHLGRWYGQQLLWGKAESYLIKSLQLNPEQPKALFELGKIYMQLENTQKALETWAKLESLLDSF